jgi:hypothetical protein
MLPLGLCETCHQLPLRSSHRGNGLVRHFQPERREPYESSSLCMPSPVHMKTCS